MSQTLVNRKPVANLYENASLAAARKIIHKESKRASLVEHSKHIKPCHIRWNRIISRSRNK